uniref:Apple domain-containing protein n=1 Tax=Schistosoma mansoni TaxID=6183 RepID=A0A5K4F7U9_SCHMA
MHCNYSQWISISGRPIQSFLQNYWLETVNAKSDCFILCQYNPRCNLYSHKAVEPELCNLYSGLIENTTININSTDHYVTGGRVCCCKLKSLFFITVIIFERKFFEYQYIGPVSYGLYD